MTRKIIVLTGNVAGNSSFAGNAFLARNSNFFVFQAPIPTRFVFILLVPLSHSAEELEGVGRCLGALLTDHEYQQVAYFATDVADLCYGIDAFMRDMIMIPPGKWNPDTFLEPGDAVEEAFSRQETPSAPHTNTKMTLNLEGLQYTGK